MKKTVSVIICILVIMFASVFADARDFGFENFKTIYKYQDGQYFDVSPESSLSKAVKTVTELGLMHGTRLTSFSPDEGLTIREAYEIAARLHSIYYENPRVFSGKLLGESATKYLIENGVTTEAIDYDIYINRADFITLLYKALPDEAFKEINTAPDDAIWDVPIQRAYSEAVYKMLRAGIVSFDENSTSVKPFADVTRGYAATVVSRIVDESLRVRKTYKSEGTPCNWVYADDTYYLVKAGDTYFINVYTNVNPNCSYIVHQTCDASIANARFVQWNDDGSTLYTITGKTEGDTYIFFDLISSSGTLLAYDSIKVVVPGESRYKSEATVSTSEDNIEITEGGSKWIKVMFSGCDYPEDIAFSYYIIDSSVVSASWRGWQDSSGSTLFLNGLKEGTTIVYIELYDKLSGYYYGGTKVKVTVLPKEATHYRNVIEELSVRSIGHA